MKKQLSTIFILAVMIAGIVSCNKNTQQVSSLPEEGAGSLTISFKLPLNSATPHEDIETRAIPASTSKPITSWGSISGAVILFVDNTNTIKDARVVSIPTNGSNNISDTYMGVVANTSGYTAYIVGNYPSSWNVGTLKGQNITALNLSAPVSATYPGSPHYDAATTGYDQTGDIFVARQNNVIVNPDANNTHPSTFELARINALFRLRMDVDTKKAVTLNDKIDFTSPTAMVSIRRIATGYSFLGSTTYPIKPSGTATSPGTYAWENPAPDKKHLHVFFNAGALKDAEPSSGTHSDPASIMTGINFWDEYKVFPGGSNLANIGSGLDKFDIVISGITKDASYIPSGQTTPVPVGTRVFWSGQVQEKMGPNQILELIVALNSAGTTTLPEVGAYGNLTINAKIVQWGDIISSELPM